MLYLTWKFYVLTYGFYCPVKCDDVLQFELGDMSDSEYNGFGYVYTTWYSYLDLKVLQTNTVSC